MDSTASSAPVVFPKYDPHDEIVVDEDEDVANFHQLCKVAICGNPCRKQRNILRAERYQWPRYTNTRVVVDDTTGFNIRLN